MDEIKIEAISLQQLRRDSSGILIEQMAALTYHTFREAPWSHDMEKPRLHFDLGVDSMRHNTLAFIANGPTGYCGFNAEQEDE